MLVLRRTETLLLAALVCVLATAAPPSAQGTDVTPPTVTGRSPSPGATGVSALVSVRAVFSEAVQPATVTMVLRNASNLVVAAQTSYDPATFTATLHPHADLSGNEVFTITVSGALDLAGNALATTNWSFTTAASQFVDELTPQTGLTQPTVIEFASDGRLFVAQKDGRVWVYDNLADATPTLVADLRLSVYNFWDRGMLGMALHPSFPSVPYVYVLYTYDAIPGGTAPRWGVSPYTNEGCPNPPGATGNGCVVTGRLSRLDVGNAALWPLNHAHEQPLVTDWPQQFPSHSTGALVFGTDGVLYASGGDGASFNYVDYGQTASTPTIADPVNDGGALRSQDLRTSGDPVTLDGTVIRIDPDTGLALPDNPRWASDTDPNGRRIVGFGLRNPFRMTTRPGTRELWVGDVGWSGREEINRLIDPIDADVDNFGWPCYEGPSRQSGYDSANLPVCENLYSAGASAVVAPYLSYAHGASLQGCAAGSSSIAGLAFYPTTGGTYPSAFAGALFFADYSRRCIWAMRTGADGLPNPADVTFVQSAPSGPVNLTSGPGGDIFYPGFNDHRLHRIRYPGNLPPDAVLQGSPTSGPAPLPVSFSAAGSTDPEAGALTYAWDLDGDGAFDDGTGASASWTYTSGGVVQARVLVTDAAGLSDVAGLTILVDAAGPTAIIDTPSSTTAWRVGDVLSFSGRATDPDEPGGIPASRLSWDVIMHHCPSDCHTHAMQSFVGTASGAFTAPDHEYPSYLELRLTATDASGLQDTASVNLHPATVPLTFTTNPPGLSLAVNAAVGVAPFTRTVIIGSSNSISAPAEQQLDGVTYQFSSWSDGLPPNHNIIAPGTPTTWTATYTVPPDTTNPTAAITAPASGATVRGSIALAATATDNVGVQSVQFYVDGVALGAPDTSAPYQVTWDSTTATAGTHAITARAVDAAGNQGDSAPVSVTVDNDGPGVTMTSPASGATVAGTVTVAATAADVSGVASVQFLLNGAALGALDTSAPYEVSWATTGVLNGAYQLSARATDAVGNQRTSNAVTVTVANNNWTAPSGLVAAYTFSEGTGGTVADASGGGRTGTISGAAWTVAGRFGSALSFDGVNDWVTVADTAALDLTSGMTMEAWVYPTALGGRRTVAMKESSPGLSYALYADDGVPSRPAGYVNRSSGSAAVQGTDPLPLNTWTHIAVTYGDGELRFFVNGTQVSSVTLRGNIRKTTNPLRLGGNATWGEYFAGRLDEVRIYNRALSAAEIAAGMNQTIGGS